MEILSKIVEAWNAMSFVELWANVMTVVCIFLAGRNNVHTWWTGIVASVLFGIVFYQANLYADVTLQVFFIVTGFIGWYHWITKANLYDLSPSGDGSEMISKTETTPVSYANSDQMIAYIFMAALIAGAYGWILHTYTNAFAPWIDSTVLTFSIVAQLLLMSRKVQNWPVWVLVNTLSVPLYFSRELYLTSALYAVFFVNALVSWRTWVNLAKEQVVHRPTGLSITGTLSATGS
jgi:nicotinamide mononucleotide transporter